MKIQEIGSKQAGFLIQEPIVATVREANPLEMKPGYNNGPEQPNQRVRLSDDTGTITAYIDWPANTRAEAYRVGDMLELCCTRGSRGMSGVKVNISGQGQHYLSCRASSIRVAGVRTQAQGDPQWMQETLPAQQQRTQARSTQALPTQQHQQGRRDTVWAVKVLATLTEQLFDAFCDTDIKEVPSEAFFERASTMAMGLWISIDKNQLDFVEPASAKEPDLDWRSPSQEEDDDTPF